ncbi:methyltransferase-like protein 7A isoform X4 [Arachis ipaensis]|uniref:methyltransferase-like protein 7A isoform X4 n=1 Tax=Arachis ipaensis TaxID=130454 RepID=UPI000A2B4404|nr:methyltransferase-like protein 7A isoform X4 [Arachis ipaensis]
MKLLLLNWIEVLGISLLLFFILFYFFCGKVAKYKSQVLSNLKGKALKILEVGIGTGPNLSYYANDSDVHVVGIDPNPKMEKYARSSARLAGLLLSNFEFFQAVGEAIPLSDASVDAVVGTLVLCSVKDVDLALKEVKRVLRPGGKYVFVEHVAAKDTCRWVPPFKRYRKQHIQSWIFKC